MEKAKQVKTGYTPPTETKWRPELRGDRRTAVFLDQAMFVLGRGRQVEKKQS